MASTSEESLHDESPVSEENLEFVKKNIQAPLDSEGYVQAFTVDQLDEMEQFFQEYGFVVVRDIVDSELVEQMKEAIWSTHNLEDVPRDDPDAWLDTVDWREVFESAYNVKRGFLGGNLALDQPSFDVRGHPNVIKIFQRILGVRDVWCKFDRYGFMRPTKVTRKDGTVVEKPDWKTESNWIHWDQNPWIEPEFSRVQGLLTLSNHTATSGGFHCIPGFHLEMRNWAKRTRQYEEGCLVDLLDKDILSRIQRITMRPNSYLIWDSRLPHGNWPNQNDETWRMVMYLTYFPKSANPTNIRARAMQMQRIYSKNPFLVLNDMAKLVTGENPGAPSHDDENNKPKIHVASEYNHFQWGMLEP